MDKTKTFFTKYQLLLFFLLACLLSWWPAPFMNGQILPHGPTLAAVIVLAITDGRKGLLDWWWGIMRRPASWVWIVIGPALVFGYQGAAYVITLLLGTPAANPPQVPSMGIFLELLLLGGLWEEPGWSGYALPKQLARSADRPHGAWIAVLTVGVFRAIWHLPLFLYGHIFWFDILVFSMAFQVMIAWLYLGSGGSVFVVMLFHFTSNLMGTVMSPVFTGASRTTYYAWFMALAALIALAIFKFSSRIRLSSAKS